ncbi:MAG: hypothetical protein IPN71_04140 [Fibrobacteres bacterium]|jgi:hypothetical protein|nr:hypothetical protein [Fibrobacterota bacterium]
MTRSTFHIAIFVGFCLGLWSCVPTNEPPRFREVRLAGAFSAKDTARAFEGAISAPAGGIHLDFKVFEGAVDQTEQFHLYGAAPATSTTYWDLAKDAQLRLVNRSAATGEYDLLLIVVDVDGISDSIHVPFTVASAALRYGAWVPLEINLRLKDGFGADLERGKLVATTDPLAKNATFFLAYKRSNSAAGSYFWMELVSPFLADPPLPDATNARDDVRFLDAPAIDPASTPSQILSQLDSKSPPESFAVLTPHRAILLSTRSGLVGRFSVDSLVTNPTTGFVRLKGAYALPL